MEKLEKLEKRREGRMGLSCQGQVCTRSGVFDGWMCGMAKGRDVKREVEREVGGQQQQMEIAPTHFPVNKAPYGEQFRETNETRKEKHEHEHEQEQEQGAGEGEGEGDGDENGAAKVELRR